MKTAELKSILQSPYSRKSWISTLQFLSGKRDLVTINLSPIEIEISTKEANKIVDHFHQIGSVKTKDNTTLPIFEIILNKDIKIEHNRVAVNEFIKKHIIKDAIKGALVTFSYANVETEDDLLIFNADSSSKSEWRFSFISKNAANDFFAEAIGKETNPKKFTYIFGNNEAHRTAIERLYNLEQSRFRLDDFFEAFNVEPVSKKFFDEYKLIYKDLASYIYEIEEYKKVFTKISSDDEGTKREIRSFVGRLMGRIVFLYFLQKKNWLGASNTEFIDGSTSFLSDLFNKDTEKQNDFYTQYLCPIFFEALNTNRGNSQEFTLINGKTVCIPFLNGGLFEEEQEPSGHRNIKFRKSDFNRIFDFFNSYNFTVYENSPEEHTIAVDPEMLGHIFENLIDYNKDTGTFYTPKEIVQYMTQESLIEYLYTNTSINRLDLELLVKNQFADNTSDDELKIIDKFLESVKICDPAIGSGAFPVGMLQEIFNLKALINYRLKDKEWNPADIKQNIIQNSIYGVDIDSGAVEIARLRFWLSLVIDEGLPKPLPNLDFKILVGNSLTAKFGLDVNISSIFKDFNNKLIEGEIEDPIILKLIGDDILDLDFYKKIVKEYLIESDHQKKIAFKKLINAIKESFRSSLSGNELKQLSKARGILYNLEQKDIFGNTNGTKKEIAAAKKALKEVEKNKKEIIDDEIYKDAIEWRFEFPELLDTESNFIGFDIVIGNPPYVDSESMVKNDKPVRDLIKNKFDTTKGNWDLFIPFIEFGLVISKKNAVVNFIIPNKLISVNYTSSLREYLLRNEIISLIDYSSINVFKEASVYPIICFLKKNEKNKRDISMAVMKEINLLDYRNIIDSEKFYNDINWSKYFFDEDSLNILNIIEKNQTILNLSKFYTPSSAATVGEAYLVKDLLIDNGYININTTEYKKLINTGTIDKYCSLWGIKDTQYIKGKYQYPIIKNSDIEKINANRKIQSNSPKLIIAGMSKDFEVFYDKSGEYLAGKSTTIILGNDNDLKYLQVILNSKLYSFYVSLTYHSLKMSGGYLNISGDLIKNIPVIKGDDNPKEFLIICDILNFINEISLNNSSEISNFKSFFELVAEGLVYDLYFKEEMINNKLFITDSISYSLEKFNDLNNFEILDSKRKSSIIKELYKEWSLGEVQIKMSDYIIKSPNLLKIILQN